jgi:hypothetical protein
MRQADRAAYCETFHQPTSMKGRTPSYETGVAP